MELDRQPKLSKLIEQLQEVLKEKGDMPIYFYDRCSEEMCKWLEVQVDKTDAMIAKTYCKGFNGIDYDAKHGIIKEGTDIAVVFCTQF